MTQIIESSPAIRTIIWDVTNKCNLRCRHCYNADKYFQDNKIFELTHDEAIQAIDICKQNRIKHIHLLGGEPLKRPDLFTLIEHMRSNGISVSLTTNGTLINKEVCLRLIEHGVSPVFISIDGVKKETSEFIRGQGTYDLTLKNIKLFKKIIKQKKATNEIIISFTITNYNKSEIPLLVDFCGELDINQFNLSCLYEAGNSCNKQPYLQYKIPEVMVELEKMAEILEKTQFAPQIILELRPRFTVYLNRRYPKQKSIKYTPSYSHCLAGGPLFYMESNGDIHPCHATNNTKGKKAQQDGILHLTKTNILDYANKLLEESPYILTFNRLKNSSGYKQKLKTCQDCFLSSDCDPCPIAFYDNSTVPECEWLIQYEMKFYNSLLTSSPAVNPESDFITKDDRGKYLLKLETGGIGLEIFSLINGISSIEQIIETIAKKYTKVPKKILLRDICEYLLDLRRLQIVKF